MAAARFDVYGRYELDIERRDGEWIVYVRGEGKRREARSIFIPREINEEALGGYLDDLLHEEGAPTDTIRRIR